MTIGIVSLWHNAPELLPEFELLLAPGGWDEAILVDNASSDESQAAYVESAKRCGFSVLRYSENDVVAAWNAGMAELQTDIMVCMANDLLMIRDDWLQRLARWTMPGTLVGPYKVRTAEGIEYLDGSMIAYHRIDWERLGGLDPEYLHPGYYSDVDICWRAQRDGIDLHQTPRIVHHLTNYTSRPLLDRQGIAPNWRENRARFLAKVADG